MPRPRSERDADRLKMGAGALLSARRAAELAGAIGGTDQERLELLRQEGLVRTVNGHEVVVWADVLEWVRASSGEQPTRPTKPASKLPKAYPL